MARRTSASTQTASVERKPQPLGHCFLGQGRYLNAFMNVNSKTGEQFIGFSLGQPGPDGKPTFSLTRASEHEDHPIASKWLTAIEAKYPGLIPADYVVL